MKNNLKTFPWGHGPFTAADWAKNFRDELREMQRNAWKKRAPYWHETHDLFNAILGSDEPVDASMIPIDEDKEPFPI